MFFHPQTPLACRLTRHVHSELSRIRDILNMVKSLGNGFVVDTDIFRPPDGQVILLGSSNFPSE